MLIEETNRRQHERIPVGVPVRVSTIDPETDPWTGRSFFRAIDEVSVNLSRGGLYLQTDDAVRPGQRVLLELDLPGGKPFEAVGRVKWMNSRVTPQGESRSTGLGFEFLGGSREQAAVLDAFLSGTSPSCEGVDGTPLATE